jgi:short-subunit dehydrogenase
MQLSDSRVLITGAKKGIGQALAKACAKKGARLILVQRNVVKSQTEELQSLGAASVDVITCDLSVRDDVSKLSTRLRAYEGKDSVDIFINNAGVLTGDLIENQSDEEIINVFQVNLTSGILLTKAVLPQMLKKGSGLIVSNCSVSSYMRFPCASTYAASKAGLLAFTECLETELSGTGVKTLSLITPGIKTDMFDAIDKKYGKYFEPPAASISADEYAHQVLDAIQTGQTYLIPKGLNRVGLLMSKYAPSVFKAAIVNRFSRQGS